MKLSLALGSSHTKSDNLVTATNCNLPGVINEQNTGILIFIITFLGTNLSLGISF